MVAACDRPGLVAVILNRYSPRTVDADVENVTLSWTEPPAGTCTLFWVRESVGGFVREELRSCEVRLTDP